MADRYLYLRTTVALEHAFQPLADLLCTLDEYYDLDALQMGFGAPRWRDGLALRFESGETVAELAGWLQPALQGFATWALHDGLNQCAESPAGGPVSTFFAGSLGSRSVSQLALRFDRENPRADSVVARLRSELEQKASCRAVAFYKDGLILLVAALEPPKVTYRRCEKLLRTAAVDFSLAATGGDVFRGVGAHGDDPAAWIPVEEVIGTLFPPRASGE